MSVLFFQDGSFLPGVWCKQRGGLAPRAHSIHSKLQYNQTEPTTSQGSLVNEWANKEEVGVGVGFWLGFGYG